MTEVPSEQMRLDDALNSGKPEVIRAKLAALLRNVDRGDGNIAIYSAQVCMAELLRLSVMKLEKSSKRLECLTIILIVLTVALIVIGFPPFLEIVRR